MNSHHQNSFEEINSIKNSCFIYEKLISVFILTSIAKNIQYG
jgi:hypothetical protein